MGNISIRVNGKPLRKADITVDKGKCSVQTSDGKTYNVGLRKNLIIIEIFGDLGENLLKSVYDLDDQS